MPEAVVVGACEVACKGQLLVDGWITGASPLRSISVSTAARTIEAVAPQKGNRWVPQTARVTFRNTPSDAAVFRGMNDFLGRTPLTVDDEPAGRATYHLVKNDLAARADVTIVVGEPQRIDRKLERQPTPNPFDDGIPDFTRVRDRLSKANVFLVVKGVMPVVQACGRNAPTAPALSMRKPPARSRPSWTPTLTKLSSRPLVAAASP